jgi:ring-1,2-phenylacetyl-CoA epoxidase subunit PaaE
LAIHFHKLAVRDIRQETIDCVSISFNIPPELENDFIFRQGQNISIRTTLFGEEIRRTYSICSSPLEKELSIAVKKVPGGAFSSFANQQLKNGDILEVLSPAGSFFTELSKANKKNYVFFAAGSGITPILSIIKTILITEPESNITLAYGNKTVSSIIFREQLEALKDKYLQRFSICHILSREKTEAKISYGRIDADKCRELSALIDYSKADEFFICGPEKMIFTIKAFLESSGISKNKIHFELFTTPKRENIQIETKTINTKDEGSNITVTLDGRSFNFILDYNGNCILDAALAQGADLPYACKGGVCTTCKAKLKEGQVEMEVNYGLEPEEVAAGFILTCQSHPRTKQVEVDFDAKS